MVFFTCTPWLPQLASIVADFGHLYMSSANITGSRSAVTAAEAGEAFGEKLDLPAGADRPGAALAITRLRQDTGFEPGDDDRRDARPARRAGNHRREADGQAKARQNATASRLVWPSTVMSAGPVALPRTTRSGGVVSVAGEKAAGAGVVDVTRAGGHAARPA